jgi:hypothetical protein
MNLTVDEMTESAVWLRNAKLTRHWLERHANSVHSVRIAHLLNIQLTPIIQR